MWQKVELAWGLSSRQLALLTASRQHWNRCKSFPDLHGLAIDTYLHLRVKHGRWANGTWTSADIITACLPWSIKTSCRLQFTTSHFTPSMSTHLQHRISQFDRVQTNSSGNSKPKASSRFPLYDWRFLSQCWYISSLTRVSPQWTLESGLSTS